VPLKALSLRISTPTDNLPRGRGFYQLEEEELYLPIEYAEGKARFFSYLESETVSLHLDKTGRLIFIELTLPRRRWRYKENLIVPERAAIADIRFLDFRQSFKAPSVLCDKTRENLMLRFRRGSSAQNYFLAENLIAQVNDKKELMAIWVTNIIDDIAGREISSWRKSIRGEDKKPVRPAPGSK